MSLRATTSNKQEKQAGIYMIRNNVTGKIYVGQTEDFKRRTSTHKSMLKAGRGQKELQKDWKTFGPSAFDFKFLWSPQDGDLTTYEQLILNVVSELHGVYNKRKCFAPTTQGKHWMKENGVFKPLDSKRFKSINVETKEEKEYNNIQEAMKDGHHRSSVINCLAGRRKTANGFMFEVLNNGN